MVSLSNYCICVGFIYMARALKSARRPRKNKNKTSLLFEEILHGKTLLTFLKSLMQEDWSVLNKHL